MKNMKLKKIMLSLLVTAVGASADAQVGWLDQVNGMIAHGEFKKAELVMKKLPKKVRKAEAVRIDSLQTIMERIRKDFNMTPDQGKTLIRERMPEATDAQIANWIANRKIEVMDIDGPTGGYNLTLAFATARKAVVAGISRP